MDFRQPLNMETALRSLAKANGYSNEEIEQAIHREGRGKSEALGFDHNYCLNGEGLRQVAVLSHPGSGR
jgi:hypothetical protein